MKLNTAKLKNRGKYLSILSTSLFMFLTNLSSTYAATVRNLPKDYKEVANNAGNEFINVADVLLGISGAVFVGCFLAATFFEKMIASWFSDDEAKKKYMKIRNGVMIGAIFMFSVVLIYKLISGNVFKVDSNI